MYAQYMFNKIQRKKNDDSHDQQLFHPLFTHRGAAASRNHSQHVTALKEKYQIYFLRFLFGFLFFQLLTTIFLFPTQVTMVNTVPQFYDYPLPFQCNCLLIPLISFSMYLLHQDPLQQHVTTYWFHIITSSYTYLQFSTRNQYFPLIVSVLWWLRINTGGNNNNKDITGL